MPVGFDGIKFDVEARRQRSENLGNANGIRQVFVTLEPAGAPTHALLDIEFFNAQHLAGPPPPTDFTLTGGVRKLAGPGSGEVHVTQVQAGANASVLRLRVEPIGDYSTYTLHVPQNGDFDPLFSAAPFKFRPGCFNLNCAPDWAGAEEPAEQPAIDYLAKDYDSFRHVMMTWMERRVPGWRPTSEADLDQVLIDLIAADADELSDFQDRVMNEAFFPRARKRVSLARHARLMDYHVHQGNQASTWIALTINVPTVTVRRWARVWTGERWNDPQGVLFAFVRDQACYRALNELDLYRWGDTVTALEAGATAADLTPAPPATRAEADALVGALQAPDVTRLMIEEVLDPEAGTANGRDKTARQILRLLPPGPERAQAVEDPVRGGWCVRVRWLAEDALTRRYCFVTRCPGQPLVPAVSRFYGNLAEASHGRPHETTFHPSGAALRGLDLSGFVGTSEAHHEAVHWGTVCRLPQMPLAYLDTPAGGERRTATTLEVSVAGYAGSWEERIDLVDSEGDDQHFIVETDEDGRSLVRFGNGTNGASLTDDAVVTCKYQVGQGSAGNVGGDALTGFDPSELPGVDRVWNPLDVTNGRDPEPAAEALRGAPEAYRLRQRRAVTLADYAQRAEEVEGVARAAARYRWAGSWRTVQVAVDQAGTTTLSPALRRRVADYLDTVRLIGEDLEVQPAVYVPLDVKLRLCAHSSHWPEHVRLALEMEFSDGWTAAGRRGFFHPDRWIFAQPLHASQIMGRALAVPGVDRVLSLSMRRWNPGAGGGLTTIVVGPGDVPESVQERLEMGPFEIILVENDPNHLERGRILFEVLGGRR